MSNIFDDFFKSTVFDIIAETMGFRARWILSYSESGEHTFHPDEYNVTFISPTDKQKRNFYFEGFTFNPENKIMEYLLPSFPGLYESVRNGNTEMVIIEGEEYQVEAVLKVFDGATVYAKLLLNR